MTEIPKSVSLIYPSNNTSEEVLLKKIISYKEKGVILPINKPIGPTSHNLVDYFRKKTLIRKIGHSGTLDPFATGVLILLIGRQATKLSEKFLKLDKEYETTIKLGYKSDTQDKMGNLSPAKIQKIPTIKEIRQVLNIFSGTQKQIPPMYSAKKIGGKKLYEYARKGVKIKRKENTVHIYKMDILYFKYPYLKLKIVCSSGTYIRTVGHDIGKKLNTFAYTTKLTRTKIFLDSYNKNESNKKENSFSLPLCMSPKFH